MTRPFKTREDAGKQLAVRLLHLTPRTPLVLALPRGGVPVGAEVARALHATLDVLNVRKLGVPWHPEFAMGAVAAGGVRVLNDDVILGLAVTRTELDEVARVQMLELERRERLYRAGRPPLQVAGRTVIVVHDGVATGATMRAALQVLRAQTPAYLVAAVPVAQRETASELALLVDEFVALWTPQDLFSVGAWYDHFDQVPDAEVHALLAAAAAASPPTARTGA